MQAPIELYNVPLVRDLLKSFQATASRSLSGPGFPSLPWWPGPSRQLSAEALHKLDPYTKYRLGLVDGLGYEKYIPAALAAASGERKGYMQSQVPVAPRQPIDFRFPVTIAPENGLTLSDTTLEGHRITCFDIGGEKRLCLPQILARVLPGFTLAELYDACHKLHVFCSRCTTEQLAVLKQVGVIDPSASSCGLITKTDAERLCTALLPEKPERGEQIVTIDSFKVYHECFGKCKGFFIPEQYVHRDSKCILCVTCECMFTPKRFITHSHDSGETRTCHWGFDSAHWRSYLLLAKDQPQIELLTQKLELMKRRFSKRPCSSERDIRGNSEQQQQQQGGLSSTSHAALSVTSDAKRARTLSASETLSSPLTSGPSDESFPDDQAHSEWLHTLRSLPPKKAIPSVVNRLQQDLISRGRLEVKAEPAPTFVTRPDPTKSYSTTSKFSSAPPPNLYLSRTDEQQTPGRSLESTSAVSTTVVSQSDGDSSGGSTPKLRDISCQQQPPFSL